MSHFFRLAPRTLQPRSLDHIATTLPLPVDMSLLIPPEKVLALPRMRALHLPRRLLGTLLPPVPPRVLTVLWCVPCMSIPVPLFVVRVPPTSLPWWLLARGGIA